MSTITKEQKTLIYEALKRMAIFHNRKMKEIKDIPPGLKAPVDADELVAHFNQYNETVDLIGLIDDGLIFAETLEGEV